MQVNKNIRAFWEVISKMELIDMEVDWKTNYLHINSFRHIKKDSAEYLGWIEKKIKIKYLGGFDKNYYSQMNPLIEEVRNEFQDLDPDGRKIFIDRINERLKFIRDCIDSVMELQDKFKHDEVSFKDDYFAPTMRLSSNLFIETLSKPLNMGLVSSSYKTRDFTNNAEIIYLSKRLLTATYNNLRAREDSLIVVLEIYPSIVKLEPIKSEDLPITEPKGKEKGRIGRPKKEEETFDSRCYKAYIDLTLVKTPVIDSKKAKRRLLTLLKGDFGDNPNSNMAKINRAIRNGKANNN